MHEAKEKKNNSIVIRDWTASLLDKLVIEFTHSSSAIVLEIMEKHFLEVKIKINISHSEGGKPVTLTISIQLQREYKETLIANETSRLAVNP